MFQLKKDTANAKIQQTKSSFMSFGVSKIKPLVSSKKKFRLIIHQRKKSWICIITYVKRILIFEI